MNIQNIVAMNCIVHKTKSALVNNIKTKNKKKKTKFNDLIFLYIICVFFV